MEAYQERVVVEQREIEEKSDKLRAFLDSPTFHDLSEIDQNLLLAQLMSMGAYTTILMLRINGFK